MKWQKTTKHNERNENSKDPKTVTKLRSMGTNRRNDDDDDDIHINSFKIVLQMSRKVRIISSKFFSKY